MAPIRHFRWYIVTLLACATAINYIDRQTFPFLISEIRKTISISEITYGNLNSCFLLGYGIMYAVGGKIMDRLGTRLGYAVMIVWWSAANFAMGAVETVSTLVVFRFLLGLGEGGGFPGSAKAVSEWIPPRDRSFAFGIFNTGSALGAVVAARFIPSIANQWNWRWGFFITGGLGFLWVAVWWLLYEMPSRSRFLGAAEREHIDGAFAEARGDVLEERPIRWVELFRHRELWGVMAAKFVSDAAWYFYGFWLPAFLATERHLDIKQIGYFAWIPWVFAGAGSFIGGWFSAFLSRRMSLDSARKIALAASAVLMPVTLLICDAPLNYVIVFFSMAYFGHQFFSTIMQTLPADLFPSRVVGSVAGLVGAAGAFGGMFFSTIAGQLIETHGYKPVFMLAGVMHPLAFVLILVVVRRVRRVV